MAADKEDEQRTDDGRNKKNGGGINNMGLYMFVSEQDRISKRKVSDKEMNECFQEALKCDPSLMIEEHKHFPKRKFFASWFHDYKPKTHYHIYHEAPAHDGSAYQARFQSSASGEKVAVIAYLHGIINGVMHQK